MVERVGCNRNLEAEIGLGALQPSDYLIEIVADTGGTTAKSLIAVRITG